MIINIKKSDKICLWCGKDTNFDKTREHIFPECVGGKKVLPIGDVCMQCNNFLSFLDNSLLKEHFLMMDAYQSDLNIIRKKKDKKNKERYIKERKNIQGIKYSIDTKIQHNGDGVKFFDIDYKVTSEFFVRALHKCIANTLCELYGSVYVRNNFAELLEFVKNGGDVHPWSYAISFPDSFNRVLISEPTIISNLIFKKNNRKKHIISFIHSSGIWVLGSNPYLLNYNLIESISDSIVNKLKRTRETMFGRPVSNYFGSKCYILKEYIILIGKLNFLWVIKEIEGKPNTNLLYLLTECKTCGQVNPTGISYPRNIIYSGDMNNVVSYPKNTWNHYIIEDLEKLGQNIEDLNKYMEQGISIPQENDVKRNAFNSKIKCINCNHLIEFNANDCFV